MSERLHGERSVRDELEVLDVELRDARQALALLRSSAGPAELVALRDGLLSRRDALRGEVETLRASLEAAERSRAAVEHTAVQRREEQFGGRGFEVTRADVLRRVRQAVFWVVALSVLPALVLALSGGTAVELAGAIVFAELMIGVRVLKDLKGPE